MEAVLAFVVSFLPRRYWRGAAGPGIFFSAFAQLWLSSLALVAVYTQYSQNTSDHIAEVTIEAASQEGAVDGRLRVGGAMALNALTPIGFLAVSGPGRLLAYLVFSSLVRLLGYATDHPCGDPLLTIVDELVWDAIYYVKRKTARLFHAALSRWRG